MPTTIQTIKEADKKRLEDFFKLYNQGRLKREKDPQGYIDFFKARTFMHNDVVQTLLAVFESELEETERIRYKIHDEVIDLCENSQKFKNMVTKELADKCSHLTEVINYLKQK